MQCAASNLAIYCGGTIFVFRWLAKTSAVSLTRGMYMHSCRSMRLKKDPTSTPCCSFVGVLHSTSHVRSGGRAGDDRASLTYHNGAFRPPAVYWMDTGREDLLDLDAPPR